MNKFTILHLYPKELNIYGDGGNVMCIYKRMKWRNIPCKVVEKGVGDKLNNVNFDMIFIGGGQDSDLKILQKDLMKKADTIKYALESDKIVLAVNSGYQMLGSYLETKDGSVIELLNAIDFYTVSNRKRLIGNFVYQTSFGGVVGFENHSGRTYLGDGVEPLGNVKKGFGNNGKDLTEGLRYKNVYGTYAQGPVLVKNPNFSDEIIKKMTHLDELSPLDDSIELCCQQYLIKRFS